MALPKWDRLKPRTRARILQGGQQDSISLTFEMEFSPHVTLDSGTSYFHLCSLPQGIPSGHLGAQDMFPGGENE